MAVCAPTSRSYGQTLRTAWRQPRKRRPAVNGNLQTAFTRALDRLGPFETQPALAVAVSGGADSTALAILTHGWVGAHGGTLTALVVDHALRAESADEARTVASRLTSLGIASHILTLTNLHHGPALAERARLLRYAALTEACRSAGVLHLLLGHHAADQAETLAMRVLRNTRSDGLAAMASLTETPSLRLLRPLLAFNPDRLRNFLTERGIPWVEDPSNRDLRALRPRLRQGFAGPPPTDLSCAITAAGHHRARQQAAAAGVLAHRASIRPEGFAVFDPNGFGERALSKLIQAIGAGAYPPDPDQVADLLRRPRPATLSGTRIMAAGRLGPGVLVLREEAAIQPPVAAAPGTVWDRRFRITAGHMPENTMIGTLGADAAQFRDHSTLPSVILRTLPAIRVGKILAAIPHLGYTDPAHHCEMTLIFRPPGPAAGAVFRPAPVPGA